MSSRGRPVPEVDRLPPMTHYVVGLLRRVASAPRPNPEEAGTLQESHLAHLRRLRESGELLTTGPMEEENELRGLIIFSTDKVSRARDLMRDDPLVAAGHLVLDLYTWFAPAGLALSKARRARRDRPPKVTRDP